MTDVNQRDMPDFRSNLWKYYAASILSGFAYFYNGVDTLFFRHFALSFEQVAFLISTNLITTMLLEIPTGSIADMYGKKGSILIGSMFTLGGLGFLAFGSTFGAFTIGFVLLGAGRSFRSGAESALLYDWLRAANKQDEYIKHQSRLQSAFVGIDIISGSVGFLLFGLNVRIPFIISFLSMVLVIAVQFTLKETKSKRAFLGNMMITHLTHIKEGFAIVLKSRLILWLVGFTLVYSIANGFFSQVVNLPFLQETKGFDTTQLAIMGLIWNTIQTVAVFFVGHMERRFGRNSSIFGIVIITPVVFFGLFLSNSFFVSAVLLGVYFGSMSFREIIVDSYLNTQIRDEHRATVLSINSMILSGFAIVILPILGAIVDRSSLDIGMLILVFGTLILGGLSLGVKRAFVRSYPGQGG